MGAAGVMLVLDDAAHLSPMGVGVVRMLLQPPAGYPGVRNLVVVMAMRPAGAYTRSHFRSTWA
jgi:hypothetical protein